MKFAFATLLAFIKKVGQKTKQQDLLTCPGYVMFKGLDTLIDKHWNNEGIKQNTRPAAFYSALIMQPQEKDVEEKPTEQENTINSTINATTENEISVDYYTTSNKVQT